MISIDDRWEREYDSVAIVDHRIPRRIPDNVKVLLEVLIILSGLASQIL